MADVERKEVYFPIREISKYQLQWRIKARVTHKGVKRNFQQRDCKPGQVFSIDLLDVEGGEIRGSFFNESVDKMYDKLQQGKCYTFSQGNVRLANRQYNPINHRYEIVFDKNSAVEEVQDDARIQHVKYDFSALRSVGVRPLPCCVDLCGVITSFEVPFSFTSSQGKNLVKREITIADDTGFSMGVTLWGERAQQEESVFQNHPVACLKGVSVKAWNGGRSGSLQEAGVVDLSGTLPQARTVREWWCQGGSAQGLTALTVAWVSGGGMGRALSGMPMDISEMRRASEKVGADTEHYTVHCRLADVQRKKNGEDIAFWYMACQERREGSGMPCNRRLDANGWCSSCNRTGKVAPRLTLRCKFTDYGDSCWLTAFHESAQCMISLSGEEAQAMEQGENGRQKLEGAVLDKYFAQVLQVTVRCKQDNWQGELRPNITCIGARPVSQGEWGRLMLKEIQDMLN